MKRFEVGGAILLATPSIFLLYDATDNPLYATLDGTEPTTDCWLNGFSLAADAVCKIEIGCCPTNKSAFVPAYTILGTKLLGQVCEMDSRKLAGLLKMQSSANIRLAIRITVLANSTVNVAGHVTIGRL